MNREMLVLSTWCHCPPGEPPTRVLPLQTAVSVKENLHDVAFAGDGGRQGGAYIHRGISGEDTNVITTRIEGATGLLHNGRSVTVCDFHVFATACGMLVQGLKIKCCEVHCDN